LGPGFLYLHLNSVDKQIYLIRLPTWSSGKKTNIIKTFYQQQKFSGRREADILFAAALSTVWVAPCTIWDRFDKNSISAVKIFGQI
jgi:hypothetical protein